MLLELSELNYLAVFVAAVANFALGGVWFSALFGKAWMQELNFKEVGLKAQGGMARIFISTFLCGLLAAFVLALFIRAYSAHDLASGALIGFLVAIGFIATSIGTNHLFERKSVRFFLIVAGHHVVTFVAMGLILCAFR